MEDWDVIVVGGGIGGLATAGLVAAAGRRVLVLERAGAAGGRARTRVEAGMSFNLGPHALYRSGGGRAVLDRLGVVVQGGRPPADGVVEDEAGFHALPGTPMSFLGSTALDAASRLALGGWLARLVAGRLPGPERTVGDWLAPLPERARRVAAALVRVSSYANAPDRQRADVAGRQVRRALDGVDYLDGGWGSLVTALSDPGRGVVLRTGVEVVALEGPGRVRLADGSVLAAGHVVLATSPAAARRVGVPVPALGEVRAACLDLGLARLPVPERRFVLGLAAPTYLSVHSGVARLCEDGAVVHVAKYLSPDDTGAGAQAELEALMDRAQPGWRAEVRVSRFAPALVVAHADDAVGAPRPAVDAGPALSLVGDWVETGALLADASLVAAQRAAERILAVRARAA